MNTEPNDQYAHDERVRAVEAFTARFGSNPTLVAAAPGRLNIIGEHTDYNDGLVLPIAIDRWAVIAARPSANAHSTLHAVDLEETIEIDLTGDLSPIDGSFANYVLGVVDQFAKAGHVVPNLELAISSSIAIGAGLGSSAAIETAAALACAHVTGAELDALEMAMLCRRAEHAFAGTPCGIMDMYTATHAQHGCALLLDCRTNTSRVIPLPPADKMTLLVVDTGVAHDLATGEYADRHATCQEVARLLGLSSLRDCTSAMLESEHLSDHQRRCATHVITENERVLLVTAALKLNDLEALGELMFQSHASLRDLYAVSCAELDAVVEAAAELRSEAGDGVIGARMTGGGFGGCAIVCCHAQAANRITQHLQERCHTAFGATTSIFQATAVGAARLVTG